MNFTLNMNETRECIFLVNMIEPFNKFFQQERVKHCRRFFVIE